MKIEDNIETFNSLVKRRGFIWGPSPEIYGGFAGTDQRTDRMVSEREAALPGYP